MNRKHSAVAAAVLTLCLALAACSDSGGADTADPPSQSSGVSSPSDQTSGSTSSGQASGSPSATAPTPEATSTAPASPAELPRGGREIFPKYRLVGYSGAPGSEAFGRLGIGDLDKRAAEIEERAIKPLAKGREVLPVLELIATVATRAPGDGRQYRIRSDDETIQNYLEAARKVNGILLLGIQPGRADFLPEVKAYEKWLREPDVGLALDPEWAVGSREVPGRTYGNTTGSELNQVADYVSKLVAEAQLPEKVVLFHQVAASVVTNLNALQPHEGVVLIKSVDGIGSRALKEATWRTLTRDLPDHISAGFKLFLEEDVERSGRLMKPAEVMALKPEPEYVLYE